MSCCRPGDFDDVFTERSAAADAKRYRRKGLSADRQRIVDRLVRLGIAHGTVLEVGGGIGALQIELIRAGAARAMSVELSRSYETVARSLLEECGFAGRVDRRVGNFVNEASTVPPADAVILDRVVCCYPDAATLVGAATGRTRRVLIITMPVDRWWIHVGRALINLWPLAIRSRWRFYVHPTRVVTATARHAGLQLMDRRVGFLWQMLVFAR